MTKFAELLAPIAAGAETLRTPAHWTQGRATFGGLLAAAGLAAMRRLVDPERHPRSLHVTFAGPVAPGDARLETRLLRAGRSATLVECHVLQEDGVCTSMTAAFGADRPSQVHAEPPPRPPAPEPEQGLTLPYVEGMTPTFTQHYDYRWTVGDLPFSGSGKREIGGWCALRDAAEPATHEHILGLVDAWPPTVLPMLTTPAPGSSLDWSIQFLQWSPEARAGDWWFYRAEADAAAHGYAQTRAVLWDPQGRPAALSTQTVAIFG